MPNHLSIAMERHWPKPRIHGSEEGCGEFGTGLRNQRETIAFPEAHRHEAVRIGKRVLAQLRIRISAGESPARVVEIHSAAALRRIIERFAKRSEIRDPPRLGIEAGSGARRGKVGCGLVVAVEHAVFL